MDEKELEIQAELLRKRMQQGGLKKKPLFGAFGGSKREIYSEWEKYDDDQDFAADFKGQAKQQILSDEELQQIITIALKPKTKVVQTSSFGPKQVLLLAQIKAAKMAFSMNNRSGIDIVCCIDKSGSMSGTKINLVKSSFENLFQFLNARDRLSLIVFDSKAQRLTPLVRMDDDNKKRLLNIVNEIQASGGTNIHEGMYHAFSVLKARKQANQVSGIFLLSDGLDNGAQLAVKEQMEKMKIQDNFTINCCGYGNDHDQDLLLSIANLTDGNFYYIHELDRVDEAFTDCLGGLMTTLAKDIQAIITPKKCLDSPNTIAKAYGDSSMWKKDGDSYVASIAQLCSGLQKNLMVLLEIPKCSQTFTDNDRNRIAAEFKVNFTDIMGKNQTRDCQLELNFRGDLEDFKEAEQDWDVCVNYYRILLSEKTSEANILADQGKFEEARAILTQLQEEMQNSWVKTDPEIAIRIKDAEMLKQALNPKEYGQTGQKKMKNAVWANTKEKKCFDSADYFKDNDFQKVMASKVKKNIQSEPVVDNLNGMNPVRESISEDKSSINIAWNSHMKKN